MLSEDLKLDVVELIIGKYKDRSATEFLELFNRLRIEYIKDPARVERQLHRLYNESKNTAYYL